ncbi:hypothetical protein Ciccas_012938, partial [Cichlidogyrus casuarinus]
MDQFYDLVLSVLPSQSIYEWQSPDLIPTLNEIRAGGQQILMIFGNSQDTNKLIGGRRLIRSKWPHKARAYQVNAFINKEYSDRQKNCESFKYELTVFQWLITPTVKDYIFKWYGDSLDSMTVNQKVHLRMQQWLFKSQTGKYGVNIVIGDF